MNRLYDTLLSARLGISDKEALSAHTMVRLPSTEQLQAFEACARHLSFQRAGQELKVTPAAISQRIKSLEELLGVPLFLRFNRAVRLTDAGQAFLPGIREGFLRIAAALDEARKEKAKNVLTISTAPSFAAKWLIPRLDRFLGAHPDVDVRLSTTIELVDFSTSDIDLAVRFGDGNYPMLRVEKLLSEAVTPMCSPRLLEGKSPLKAPADLRSHMLIHDDTYDFADVSPDWTMWLLAAGVEGVDPTRGPRFAQSVFALQAAVDGLGVALGRVSLAADDIAAGRLVCPFPTTMPLDLAYYFVGPEAAFTAPKAVAFREWLIAEVDES